MPYFGVNEQIYELDYSEFKVPVFMCRWVNENTSVHEDQLGFTLVDLNKVAYMDEPFIMAEQARQVFYVQDPCDSIQGRPSGISHQNDDPTLDICKTPAFSKRMPSINEQHGVDDVHANHTDHREGLWKNIPM